MISKCANPDCKTRFRYLRSGKLFHFEVITSEPGPRLANGKPPKKPVRKLEHFWLCGECCTSLTLKHERNEGVIVIPIRKQHRASA